MGLEDRLTDAVALAFENLGGDPVETITVARRYSTVDRWITAQTTQTALVGGVEVSLPGLHGATIAAGTLYLLRKMARLSWGIGAFKNAFVLEAGPNSDLRNILILWSADEDETAEPDHRAIDLDLLLHVLDTPGRLALYAVIENENIEPVILRTLYALCDICERFDGDESARELVELVGGAEVAEQAIAASARFAESQRERLATPRTAQAPSNASKSVVARTMGRKVSTKVARDVAVQLASRLPIRYLSGFIPVAGAVINATFNAQTAKSISRSAVEYYDNRLTLAEFEALIPRLDG